MAREDEEEEMNYKQANKVKHLAPDVNKVLEGLDVEYNAWVGSHRGKYFWTPQVGEWVICRHHIYIIAQKRDVLEKKFTLYGGVVILRESQNDLIPILEWEVVEEVLEKAGYELFIKGMRGRIKCHIFEAKESFTVPLVVIEQEKIARQQAVMLAVIKLGEEMK